MAESYFQVRTPAVDEGFTTFDIDFDQHEPMDCPVERVEVSPIGVTVTLSVAKADALFEELRLWRERRGVKEPRR